MIAFAKVMHLVCIAFFIGTILPSDARSDRTLKELTAESIEACKANEHNPPSPRTVMAKVHKFCDLLQEMGTPAFELLRGKDSEFIFNGTYIWVHTMSEAKVMVQPVNPSKEGKVWLYLRDITGKLYIAEMNQIVSEKKNGWVEYYYPKPGGTIPYLKTSYVLGCTLDGETYVIGSGIYDQSRAQVLAKLRDASP